MDFTFMIGFGFALVFFLFAETIWRKEIQRSRDQRSRCVKQGWAQVLDSSHVAERPIYGGEVSNNLIYQYQYDLEILDENKQIHKVSTSYGPKLFRGKGHRARILYNPDDISDFIVLGQNDVPFAGILVFVILSILGILSFLLGVYALMI